jgi:hypothetical protein
LAHDGQITLLRSATDLELRWCRASRYRHSCVEEELMEIVSLTAVADEQLARAGRSHSGRSAQTI